MKFRARFYGMSPKGRLDQDLFDEWFTHHFLHYASGERPLLSLTLVEQGKGYLTASSSGLSVVHPSHSHWLLKFHQCSPLPNTTPPKWVLSTRALPRMPTVQYWAGRKACKLTMTGLCVNPNFPHIGDSPELLEIKCTFSVRHNTLEQISYLQWSNEGQ